MNQCFVVTVLTVTIVLMMISSLKAQKLWNQPVGTTFTYSRDNDSTIVSTWVIEAADSGHSGFEVSIKTTNDVCRYFKYLTIVNNSTLVVYRERGEGSNERCKFDYTFTPGYILATAASNFTSTSMRNNTVNGTTTVLVTKGQTDEGGPVSTPFANYTSTTRVTLIQNSTVDNIVTENSLWIEPGNRTIVMFTLGDENTYRLTSIGVGEPQTSSANIFFSALQQVHLSLSIALGMILLL